MRLILLIAALALPLAGCPEAEKKHEEVTDKVGHAAKNKLNAVEDRVNKSAKAAADRLNAAAAEVDKQGEKKDEGGW